MKKPDSIEIKVAMLRAKLSQAQVARELKITRATVNQVISGRAISKRVSDYLAKRLQKAA